jgi:hypothetical protein
MGCAPTNRKRSTTPAAEAKPLQSSIVHTPVPILPEDKENITSIENLHRISDKQRESLRQIRPQESRPSRPRVDPFNDDIMVKDERRGFSLEKMDFSKKEHLQGY